MFRKSEDEVLYDSAYGSYELDESGFRYGYEHYAGIRETAGGLELFKELWPADAYTAKVAGSELHLMDSDENGSWGFILAGDRLSFVSDGEVLRVYRRVVP